MALHDRYARRTPFELAFPDRERAQRLAEEAHAEAEARGIDPQHPQMFATLGSVGGYLTELRDPESSPEAMHQYAALAFHSVAFTRAGCPLYLLSTDAARAAVSSAPDTEPRPPSNAGYLQLPQHLFWVEAGGPEQVPESLDGLFWTITRDQVLHTLLVTGLRPDRPGLGVIPVPEAPLADAVEWARARVRVEEEGPDFESSIPGADIDALYGIRTAGESLKLLARVFAWLIAEPRLGERHEPPVRSGDQADAPDTVGHSQPSPSALPYILIGFEANDDA